MNLGSKGIELIKKYEGCRLEAYKCPAGVWTIGWGHTGDVYEGQKITQAEADKLFDSDIVRYVEPVQKYSGLNQNQFDALVSFCFNCGQGALEDVMSSGNVTGTMALYVNGGGVKLPGLVRRRNEEIELYNTPDHKKVHVGEYLNVKEFNEGFGIFKDDSSWETWNRLTYLGCPISAVILDNPRKNVYRVKDCRYGFEGYCYIEENNNTTFTSYQAYIEKKEENKEVLFRVLADGIQVSDTCKAKWIPEIIEEQLKKGAKDIKVFQCN